MSLQALLLGRPSQALALSLRPGGVLVAELRRPQVLNAVGLALAQDVVDVAKAIRDNSAALKSSAPLKTSEGGSRSEGGRMSGTTSTGRDVGASASASTSTNSKTSSSTNLKTSSSTNLKTSSSTNLNSSTASTSASPTPNSSYTAANSDAANSSAVDVRAVVVVGAGRAFSTGRDLKESRTHSRDDAARFQDLVRASADAWQDIPVPTIAAIHGPCWGWVRCCTQTHAQGDALMAAASMRMSVGARAGAGVRPEGRGRGRPVPLSRVRARHLPRYARLRPRPHATTTLRSKHALRRNNRRGRDRADATARRADHRQGAHLHGTDVHQRGGLPVAAPQPVRLVLFFAQRTRMVLTRASPRPPPPIRPSSSPSVRPNPTAYCSVADAGKHLDVALQLADAIAANGPLGVASAKAVLNDVVHRPHEGLCASALGHYAAFRLRTHQLNTSPRRAYALQIRGPRRMRGARRSTTRPTLPRRWPPLNRNVRRSSKAAKFVRYQWLKSQK